MSEKRTEEDIYADLLQLRRELLGVQEYHTKVSTDMEQMRGLLVSAQETIVALRTENEFLRDKWTELEKELEEDHRWYASLLTDVRDEKTYEKKVHALFSLYKENKQLRAIVKNYCGLFAEACEEDRYWYAKKNEMDTLKRLGEQAKVLGIEVNE